MVGSPHISVKQSTDGSITYTGIRYKLNSSGWLFSDVW